MPMGAEMTVRPFQAASDGDVPAAPAPVFLAVDKDRPVDPVIWGDEERMKRELMAWAKAVASMALNVSSTPPSMRQRRQYLLEVLGMNKSRVHPRNLRFEERRIILLNCIFSPGNTAYFLAKREDQSTR